MLALLDSLTRKALLVIICDDSPVLPKHPIASLLGSLFELLLEELLFSNRPPTTRTFLLAMWVALELTVDSLISPFVQFRNPCFIVPLLGGVAGESMFMDVTVGISELNNRFGLVSDAFDGLCSVEALIIF